MCAKQHYSVIHHFYDQMCPECAEFNFNKRTSWLIWRGRVALLTGGRVKIGYQTGLKLLRAGARLIVTTRFPRDSAQRYAREPDFAKWSDRLEIFGLDLRHTPSVEALCTHLLATLPRLDFIINNGLPDRSPSTGVLQTHDAGAQNGALMMNGRDACYWTQLLPQLASGRLSQRNSNRAADPVEAALPERASLRSRISAAGRS